MLRILPKNMKKRLAKIERLKLNYSIKIEDQFETQTSFSLIGPVELKIDNKEILDAILQFRFSKKCLPNFTTYILRIRTILVSF